jgi:uncharacterized protein (TIGR00296 family)
MSIRATKEMCFLCFEALENATKRSNTSKVASRVIPASDPSEFPLFVTWKRNGTLRGCIGCFDALPLWDGLREYAVTAGTKDGRFNPIDKSELGSLTCAVSLLHSFEDCASATDWEVGVHGIRLFIDGRRATYLPEVAADRGWSKVEALQHLAVKGKFTGVYDDAAIQRSKVIRYQSSKISASWAEYQEFVQGL